MIFKPYLVFYRDGLQDLCWVDKGVLGRLKIFWVVQNQVDHAS